MDENQLEKLNQLSRNILQMSRNSLLVKMRFLDLALSMFEYEKYLGTIATNGKTLFYNPVFILKSFRDEREYCTRAYLHVVFHCVFRHMFVSDQINLELWDLACDIAVENMISELQVEAVTVKKEIQETTEIAKIKSEIKSLTAEKIYRWLVENNLSPARLAKLEALFCYDDHSVWYIKRNNSECSKKDPNQKESCKKNKNSKKDSSEEEKKNSDSEQKCNNNCDDPEDSSDNKNRTQAEGNNGTKQKREDSSEQSEEESSEQPEEDSSGQDEDDNKKENSLPQKWQDISERMQEELESFSKKYGSTAGGMMQNLKEVNRERYDYSSFLKKFAVKTEVMKINDDEFDYIFYTYGLNLYNKMPLIEPLEYKDDKQIREFVIAIDTSGSTSGELVQKFVQKTYNILKSTESFSSRINLHIIQCDTDIQEAVKITTQDELDTYIKSMTIKGLGGTDFRPVFQFVNQLIQKGEFTRLKGLIYFTDGFGLFPSKKPEYETAFVFVDDSKNNLNVPSWAIKLILQHEDLQKL